MAGCSAQAWQGWFGVCSVTPEGPGGCWSHPSSRGCFQGDDSHGKEQFPPELHLPAPQTGESVPWVLQSPSSPTRLVRLGLLFLGILPKRLWREAKGAGENLSSCGMQAQGWEGLAWDFEAVSRDSGLGRAWLSLGRTCGKGVVETGSFYPIKTCLSSPRDGGCSTSPQGSTPTLTFKEHF